MTKKETRIGEPDQTIDAATAARYVRQRLESLKRSGLATLVKPTGKYRFSFANSDGSPNVTASTVDSRPGNPDAGGREQPATKRDVPSSTSTTGLFAKSSSGSYENPPRDPADRVTQLKMIQTEVAQCTRCSELVANRTQTVFGVGNAGARLCFIGEGPGADEDRLGEPFVGAAGQLLDRIIDASQLNRQDVYILNTVKCRPPGNRNPNENELGNCWQFAQRQLEIIQPEFICCLGSVAARTLLKTTQSIGRLRGQFFQFCGSRVMVTYHPAYLLRNPGAKRQVWDDMKMLLQEMGIGP